MRANQKPIRTNSKPESADFKSQLINQRPLRADMRPKRADLRSEGADFRPELPDVRPERLNEGTNKHMNKQKSPGLLAPEQNRGLFLVQTSKDVEKVLFLNELTSSPQIGLMLKIRLNSRQSVRWSAVHVPCLGRS